jgi:hypothetical protein
MATQNRIFYFKRDNVGDVWLYGTDKTRLKYFCEGEFKRLFPKIKITRRKYTKVKITITEIQENKQ